MSGIRMLKGKPHCALNRLTKILGISKQALSLYTQEQLFCKVAITFVSSAGIKRWYIPVAWLEKVKDIKERNPDSKTREIIAKALAPRVAHKKE